MEFPNPTLFLALVGSATGIFSIIWHIRTEKRKDKMSFMKDYKDHIKPLLEHFSEFVDQESIRDDSIEILFTYDSLMSKKILQHMYTCGRTRFLYDMIRDVSDGKNVDSYDFQKKFCPLHRDLISSPFPKFGFCEDCNDHFPFFKKWKQNRFLKNVDPKMWSLFEPHSQ